MQTAKEKGLPTDVQRLVDRLDHLAAFVADVRGIEPVVPRRHAGQGRADAVLGGAYVGPLAQEVAKVFPRSVATVMSPASVAPIALGRMIRACSMFGSLKSCT